MMILSSPSGAGKTTLAARLLASDPQLNLSISATTRPPRPGEQEGEDYYFKSIAEFERMRSVGAFLESALVFGNYYGTPREPVEAALSAGRDVLFDIDWQGAQQVSQRSPNDVVKVFILPPSRVELERRLRARKADPEEVVRNRMAKADSEISHWAEYDYVIVNDDLDESERRLKAILTAERSRRDRQVGLHDFVRRMLRDS
ncbi:MAG: guanylate kinase [Alphaproteobacteria bacterium]|nr:guanylate kinase [Alphaproteobacteria bacterium]